MSEQKDQQQRLMALSKQRLRNDRQGLSDSLGEFVRTIHPDLPRAALDAASPLPLYQAFKLVCEASKIKVVSAGDLGERDPETMDVDYLARVCQINHREVFLEDQWWT